MGAKQQKGYLVMLKTLALSASVLAFATGLAFAEAPTSSLSTDHWLVSDVYIARCEHSTPEAPDLGACQIRGCAWRIAGGRPAALQQCNRRLRWQPSDCRLSLQGSKSFIWGRTSRHRDKDSIQVTGATADLCGRSERGVWQFESW
jgi:hypothetical protein